MTQFALIVVVMVAFAANSVLTRMGIWLYGMDVMVFSGLRLLSGAAMLAVIVILQRNWPRLDRARIVSAGALLFYLLPFSLAYVSLPSGLGALILFGVVQLTMFAGSAFMGSKPTPRQLIGMVIAMTGLCWLLWPSEAVPFVWLGNVCMILAGISWGVFSLRGRGSQDPLADMAVSFVVLAPVAVLLLIFGQSWPWEGVVTAVISGAITSGLGYALWYYVLPGIPATTAAVAQLSVPVLAIVGGAILLAEPVTAKLVFASSIVLGGIAVAVLRR